MSYTCPICEKTSHHDEYCAHCESERRDSLALRKIRGEDLTEEEQQLLEKLNQRFRERHPREGLPVDVKAVIEELLRNR